MDKPYGFYPITQKRERSHRPMDDYRVKCLRHGRESHIKINLATASMEICSQAIVGENNDGGVYQRHLENSVIK